MENTPVASWEAYHTDLCARAGVTLTGTRGPCTCGLEEAVEAYVEKRIEIHEQLLNDDAREHGENW